MAKVYLPLLKNDATRVACEMYNAVRVEDKMEECVDWSLLNPPQFLMIMGQRNIRGHESRNRQTGI